MIYDGNKTTFYEFTVKWLEEYAKYQLEPTTISGYVHYLDKHIIPYFGHFKLTEIKPMHLQEFCITLMQDGIRTDGKSGGYSSSTVKKYHAVISTIMTTAYKWKMIESNPCERVKPPKQEDVQHIKHFTLEQADMFLKALDLSYTSAYKEHTRISPNGNPYTVQTYTETRSIPTQFRVLFNMALFGGFRRGELVALTWDKISFENSTVSINSATGYANKKTYNKAPKTKGSVRTVTLPESVMKMLKEYKLEQEEQKNLLADKWEGENYVFIQWNGKQMHLSTPSHVFREVIEKYNATVPDEEKLPFIGLHGLRHTSATLLISANADIKTVSARLGHSQASTTLNIYCHSLKKQDEVCANTLDNLFHKNNEVKTEKKTG